MELNSTHVFRAQINWPIPDSGNFRGRGSGASETTRSEAMAGEPQYLQGQLLLLLARQRHRDDGIPAGPPFNAAMGPGSWEGAAVWGLRGHPRHATEAAARRAGGTVARSMPLFAGRCSMCTAWAVRRNSSVGHVRQQPPIVVGNLPLPRPPQMGWETVGGGECGRWCRG